MSEYSLVHVEVSAAEAGAAVGALTSGTMVAYVRGLLVAAGWRAEGPVENIVEDALQCALDHNGIRFVLSGAMTETRAGSAHDWRAAVISMGPESRRGFLDRLLGRNRPDPAAAAEARNAALAILGRAAGIRNLRGEA